MFSPRPKGSLGCRLPIEQRLDAMYASPEGTEKKHNISKCIVGIGKPETLAEWDAVEAEVEVKRESEFPLLRSAFTV
ncbi:unnamed protein product [Toxocara canis]|uniref:Uncharacterized protein n=1 Tax=Toxocara canis TaxID=6265 RepID=A0A183U983_TOXCA|nr:unnamed protein product [Toxocara canis]